MNETQHPENQTPDMTALTPASTATPTTERSEDTLRRPIPATALSVIYLVCGAVISIIGAYIVTSGAMATGSEGGLALVGVVIGAAYLLFGAIALALGYGLRKGNKLAWIFNVILVGVSVVGGITNGDMINALTGTVLLALSLAPGSRAFYLRR